MEGLQQRDAEALVLGQAQEGVRGPVVGVQLGGGDADGERDGTGGKLVGELRRRASKSGGIGVPTSTSRASGAWRAR